MVMRKALILVAAAAVGCGSLETPSIVLDLRVLGISVDPPEIVAPFVPDNPEAVVFDDVEVCALVADPGASRQLAFNMVACAPTDTLRCDQADQPRAEIGFGVVDDPEEAAAPVELCATLSNSDALYDVIEDSVRVDTLAGFGGIGVQVELSIRPEPGSLDEAQFAAKQMLYSPQFPPDRVANRNPWLDQITATDADGDAIALPLGRCGDVTPVTVDAGAELELLPVEPEGVREDYVVPTFDGAIRELTENLRYAWYATSGDWSANNTGGPRDFAGNDAPLDSTWTAPEEELGAEGLDVSLWVVQRDERGGLAWYQSCVHVDAAVAE
jgi:hypothetical protein